MKQEQHDRAFEAGFRAARDKINKHYGTPEQYEKYCAESFATSTALPLAQPAAVEVKAWHYQRHNEVYPTLPDHVVVVAAAHRWTDATGWVETPLYALAPAAIASGREGAE